LKKAIQWMAFFRYRLPWWQASWQFQSPSAQLQSSEELSSELEQPADIPKAITIRNSAVRIPLLALSIVISWLLIGT